MLSRRRLVFTLAMGIAFAASATLILAGRGEAPDTTAPGIVLNLEQGATLQLSPGLYVLEPATGDVRRVLEQKGFDFARPSYQWSADGEWLVSTSIGNFEKIVAVRRDGGERREAQGQAWSVVRLDDGSFVLHMRPGSLEDDLPEIQGRLDILTMSVGQLMQAAEDAAISPDGRSAAHLMKNSLTLVDLGSGQERRRLTKPGGYLAWAPAGDTPWSPDGKMLAFVDYESEAALSVLRVDGDTPPLKLAPDVSGAAWSPDSKRLAYVVTEYPAEEGALPESHIEVGQADGGGSKFRVDEAESPAWTPDGSALAFVRQGEIWRVDLDTGREERLVAAVLPLLTEPRWSPDGRFLAFRVSGTVGDILAIDADGKNERAVGIGTDPTWSPDGEQIAFLYGSGGLGFFGGIATMKADGSEAVTLGRVLYSDALPACMGDEYEWSPDSAAIAYWTDDEGSLFVAPADGSEEATRIGTGLAPTWSPDSHRVMYSAAGPRFICNLYTLSKDGGTPELVLEAASEPEWSPDGAWVVAKGDPRTRSFNLVLFRADDPADRRDLGPGARPVWSPDSSRIAYYRSQGGAGIMPPELGRQGAIVVQAVDPADATVIEIPVQGFVGDYAWSPDGRRLAVTISNQQDLAIYIVDLADPANPRRLTEGHSPSWSPDGKTIVFARYYTN